MTPEEKLLWEIFSEPEDRDTPLLDSLMSDDGLVWDETNHRYVFKGADND